MSVRLWTALYNGHDSQKPDCQPPKAERIATLALVLMSTFTVRSSMRPDGKSVIKNTRLQLCVRVQKTQSQKCRAALLIM